MATLYTNSAGKIFTLGGKLVVSASALNIGTTQTLNMPSGDQLVVSLADQSNELYISTDLDLDFIWQNSSGDCYHWPNTIDPDYLVGGSLLHIFEFDYYEWQNDSEWQDCFNNTTAEAYFIRDYGRYLGTIWIANNQWQVADKYDLI